MDSFSGNAIAPADLGLVLQLSRIIEVSTEDHYGDQKATVAAIVVGFQERVASFDGKKLAKWLQISLSEWMRQSPAENFGLTMSQWQAARALEELAKAQG